MTTPGPFTARPLGDGAWIVVGRDDDEGDTHTVCRAEPCEVHAGRAQADAEAIAAALNAMDGAEEEFAFDTGGFIIPISAGDAQAFRAKSNRAQIRRAYRTKWEPLDEGDIKTN